MYYQFLTISPLLSASPVQDVNIHKATGIGGTIVISWIGEAEQICRMNIQTNENLRIFWGVHLALPIGGVIAERNILYRFAYLSRCRRLLIWLQQVEREICILNINYVFKWQKVIDCHSPRLKLNHSHFSLLSSFNLRIIKSGKLAFPSSIDRSVPGVLINLRVCAKLNLAKICLKKEN
jgi:hypothetical protein